MKNTTIFLASILAIFFLFTAAHAENTPQIYYEGNYIVVFHNSEVQGVDANSYKYIETNTKTTYIPDKDIPHQVEAKKALALINGEVEFVSYIEDKNSNYFLNFPIREEVGQLKINGYIKNGIWQISSKEELPAKIKKNWFFIGFFAVFVFLMWLISELHHESKKETKNRYPAYLTTIVIFVSSMTSSYLLSSLVEYDSLEQLLIAGISTLTTTTIIGLISKYSAISIIIVSILLFISLMFLQATSLIFFYQFLGVMILALGLIYTLYCLHKRKIA